MTRTVYWLKHNKGHCLHYNISVHGFNLHASITCSLLPSTSAALWKAVILVKNSASKISEHLHKDSASRIGEFATSG